MDKDFEGVVELRRQLKQLEAEIENRTPANVAALGQQGLARIGSRPPTPTGVQATPATGRILLTWNAVNVADLMRYEVQISTNEALGAAETFYTGNNFFTWEKAVSGTTYYLRVRAVNTAGVAGAYSNIVSTAPKLVTVADAPISSASPMVLVASHTVNTATANVNFQNLTNSDYKIYEIRFWGLIPDALSTNNLRIQLYMDGVLATGAVYDRQADESDTASTHGQTSSTAATQFNLNRSTSQFGIAGAKAAGVVWLYKNQTTSHDPQIYWRYTYADGGGTFSGMWGSGRLNNSGIAGICDGILFDFSGANIDAGAVFFVYGWTANI